MLFLKRQYQDAIAELQQGARRRPRGPAGALQSDALLPGAGRRRDGEEARRRSTSASRPTSRRRPSPARTASCTPHDNNERQSIHEHGSAIAQPPAEPARPRRRIARRGASRRPRRGRRGSRPGRVDEATARVPRSSPRRRSASRRCAARRPAGAPGIVFTRRHAARAGIRFTPHERRLRQEVPARDDGLGRARSSTSTATAGPDICLRQLDELARAAPGSRRCPRSTATTATARFTDVTRAAGLGARDVRHGRRRRRLRQRRPGRPLRHRPRRRTTSSATSAAARFADVTAKAGVGRPGLLDERHVLRLRQGRQARPRSSPTTSSWSIEKDLFCTLDGKTQVLLHARVLQGPEPARSTATAATAPSRT